MRIRNIDAKLTLKIPFGKPDMNSVVYSKEAVEKAVNSLEKNLPIIYRDSSDASDGKVIGITTGDCHIVTWDSENQTCSVTIDGVIRFGGTECIVNKMENGIVSDFTITGLGVSL